MPELNVLSATPASRLGRWLAAVSALAAVLALLGCTDEPKPEPRLTCEQVVAAVEPVPAPAGLEDLPVISIALALSTDARASFDQWRSALKSHPQAVGLPAISDEDVPAYAYGACVAVVRDQERTNAVCDEARQEYSFDYR